MQPTLKAMPRGMWLQKVDYDRAIAIVTNLLFKVKKEESRIFLREEIERIEQERKLILKNINEPSLPDGWERTAEIY